MKKSKRWLVHRPLAKEPEEFKFKKPVTEEFVRCHVKCVFDMETIPIGTTFKALPDEETPPLNTIEKDEDPRISQIFELIDQGIKQAENGCGELYTTGRIKQRHHRQITNSFEELRTIIYIAMTQHKEESHAD